MKRNCQKIDRILFILLLAMLAGIPLAVKAYDRDVWRSEIPPDAKVFTLTGNTEKGWILGDVHAYNILTENEHGALNMPRITVRKGDKVVFKLKSSDVIHGFSLKELAIFVNEGIHPGQVKLVSFVADKVGEFTFSCNAICGNNHDQMKGILVVTA